jgi:hypothetical protein
MRICPPGWIGLALAVAWVAAVQSAAAAPERDDVAFEPNERRALLAGERVERPLEFIRGRGQYVGGVSYQLLRTPPEQVLLALRSAENLAKMLPRTRSARLVSRDANLAWIELRQGPSPFVAEYTVLLERDEQGDEVRFWLDPRYDHDIEDVWGFIRVREFGLDRTLLSVGAVVDLGPGLTRALFEEKVQAVILSSVSTIRDFVEPRHLAAVDRAFRGLAPR